MSARRKRSPAPELPGLPASWTPIDLLDPTGFWHWKATEPGGAMVGQWAEPDEVTSGWVWADGPRTGHAENLAAACAAARPAPAVAPPAPARVVEGPDDSTANHTRPARLVQVLLFPTARCPGCDAPIAERAIGAGRPGAGADPADRPWPRIPGASPASATGSRDGVLWTVTGRPRSGHVVTQREDGVAATWTKRAWRTGGSPLSLPTASEAS